MNMGMYMAAITGMGVDHRVYTSMGMVMATGVGTSIIIGTGTHMDMGVTASLRARMGMQCGMSTCAGVGMNMNMSLQQGGNGHDHGSGGSGGSGVAGSGWRHEPATDYQRGQSTVAKPHKGSRGPASDEGADSTRRPGERDAHEQRHRHDGSQGQDVGSRLQEQTE